MFYPNTQIWDPGKLEENFYPWEAEMVSRIQVSDGSAEDLLVWPRLLMVPSVFVVLIDSWLRQILALNQALPQVLSSKIFGKISGRFGPLIG